MEALEEAISFLFNQQRSKKEWLSMISATDNRESKQKGPILNLSWIPEAWWRWINLKKKKGRHRDYVTVENIDSCVSDSDCGS